jgi:hypothetical protein
MRQRFFSREMPSPIITGRHMKRSRYLETAPSLSPSVAAHLLLGWSIIDLTNAQFELISAKTHARRVD